MEETQRNLKKSEGSLEGLKVVLSEPEEKLTIYKAIIPDIIMLDNYIKERDNLNQMIEAKKREMTRAGIELSRNFTFYLL